MNYPELPARYYTRFVQMLEQMGIDTGAILRRARISRKLIERADGMLPLDKADQLISDAVRTIGRTDLGFELGRSLRISAHSIVGYGILTSPTLDYAFRLLALFFKLITPTFRMRYHRDPQKAHVLFDPVLPLSHESFAVHLEAITAGVHGILLELLQERMPRHDIYLSIAEPDHATRYAELSGARCRFGWKQGSGLEMTIPAIVFDYPPALADSTALELAENRCFALLESAVARGKMADWIRMMLREASDGHVSLSDLAHTLNISTRTLDRHLRREGNGFRELMREVLHERACKQLATTKVAITRIAIDLGYSDAANFTRAFRRESGLSPSQYRLAQPLSS
ncbi:MAG: AraC family transcriptional regulator ligand-binding domain-containing protein [Stenotrophobium sp.]